MSVAPIRVLIVDDSKVGRHVIAEALSTSSDLLVVGQASNGEQALRMVAELEPDAITLDLEMPRMGGLAFLRILMTQRPMPVVVLSSQSQPENVFKALELGALDFIPKQEGVLIGGESLRTQLIEKLSQARVATNVRGIVLARPTPSALRHASSSPAVAVRPARPKPISRPPEPLSAMPKHLVAIASSTGGPAALLAIFTRIQGTFGGAILVAQHMPQSFTRSFAERLDRTTVLTVVEARDGDPVRPGHAYICPGGACMSVRREPGGYRALLAKPTADDRYVPSADRLLRSVAESAGSSALGVILTGMANDGVEGAAAIRRAGGTVIAESEATAVIYGMPKAAANAGHVNELLPLPDIAIRIAALA